MSDKEDSVSKDHQKIIGMASILVVVFLFVITAYGVATDPKPHEHPDPWYVYIERFQTLIGGLLAVGAAFITIRQMRKTDEAAMVRHHELLRFQRQPFMVANNALQLAHGTKLIRFRDQIETHLTLLQTLGDHKEGPEQAVKDVFLTLESVMQDFDQLVTDTSWDVNYQFLNSDARVALARLRNKNKTISELMATIEDAQRGVHVAFVPALAGNDLAGVLHECRHDLRTMFDALGRGKAENG